MERTWRAVRWAPAAWPMRGCTRPRGAHPSAGSQGVSSRAIPLGERACGDLLTATEVAARDAAADAGNDLVADRPTCGREIVGGLFRAGLGADEHDLVALPRAVDLGDVEHHEVHADPAREADAAASEDHPAPRPSDPRETIAVADRDRRDPTITRQAVFVPVGDPGALRHARDAVHAGMPGKRGSEL